MDNTKQIEMINIDLIIPNRFQPRLTFDENELNNLANSIKEHGIIQPLVLRKLNDKYEIIAGERRYKAAQIVGLTSVPAIIKDIDDKESAEVALIENVQRQNLNPMEEARSYKKILDKGYLTQEALAQKIGISQSTLANRLRLLNLALEVQDALLNNRISERHARSLLTVHDDSKQVELLNRVINERLTVRQLDQIIRESNNDNNILILDNKKEENSMDFNMFNPFTNSGNSSNSEQNNIFNNNSEESKTEVNEAPEIFVNPFINNNISNEVSPKPQDEEIETLETLDDIINEGNNNDNNIVSSSINNFLNKLSGPVYPSLEDEKVNMDTDSSDSFNPFSNLNIAEELPVKEEAMESLDNKPLEEVKIPEKIIKKGDINSVKLAYKNLKEEIEAAGFNIVSEEFNFEDMFQLIIKVDKPKED